MNDQQQLDERPVYASEHIVPTSTILASGERERIPLIAGTLRRRCLLSQSMTAGGLTLAVDVPLGAICGRHSVGDRQRCDAHGDVLKLPRYLDAKIMWPDRYQMLVREDSNIVNEIAGHFSREEFVALLQKAVQRVLSNEPDDVDDEPVIVGRQDEPDPEREAIQAVEREEEAAADRWTL